MGRTVRARGPAASASACSREDKMRGWRKKQKRHLKRSAKNKGLQKRMGTKINKKINYVGYQRPFNLYMRNATCTLDGFQIPWKKKEDGSAEASVSRAIATMSVPEKQFDDPDEPTLRAAASRARRIGRKVDGLMRNFQTTTKVSEDLPAGTVGEVWGDPGDDGIGYLTEDAAAGSSPAVRVVSEPFWRRIPQEEDCMWTSHKRHPRYLAACAKQLQRRGKLGAFVGHRHPNPASSCRSHRP